jgi:uncharacterized protein with PQ loop repeat
VHFYDVTVWIGWIAVLLGMIVAATQFNRINANGVEGVSLATWALFVLLSLFWACYGVSIKSWEVVLGSLVALPFQLFILIRLRPWARREVIGRSFLFFALACFVPAYFWGWTGAVIAVGMAGSVTRGPQLIHLIRHEGAIGVSVRSWATAAFVSGLWIIFYYGAHLWAVLVVTAFAGSVSLAIAVLARWRQLQLMPV